MKKFAAYHIRATKKPVFVGYVSEPHCDFLDGFYACLFLIGGKGCIQTVSVDDVDKVSLIEIGGIDTKLIEIYSQYGGY